MKLTDEFLERFRLTLDDLIAAARREAAYNKANAAELVRAGTWEPEEARRRVAEMEAIAGVLECLKLGESHAIAAAAPRKGAAA